MSGKGAKGLSGKGAKGTITGKQKSLDDKKKPISRSARAGLQFPVGRIHRLLKVRRTVAHSTFLRDTSTLQSRTLSTSRPRRNKPNAELYLK